MRFAHLADLHLGYRQYGLYERALDFNRAFSRAVDIILKRNVSFAVISGDLFHYRLPPAMAVRRAFEELSRLQKADIPVVISRGNHDASMVERGGNYLHLLSDRGVATYLEEDRCFTDLKIGGDRVRIVGVGCYPESQIKEMLDRAKANVDPAATYNILMLHQTFDKVPSSDQSWPILTAYLGEDRFKAVNYYALGHVHTHNLKHPDLPAYYPGSIESWDLSDGENHIFDMRTKAHRQEPQKPKGFLIVELHGKEVKVEPITVPTRRMRHLIFRYGEVDPKEATQEVSAILPEFNEEHSIVSLTVEGYVKKGCRRSDLDSRALRGLLDRTLKSRVINDLRYPSLLKTQKPSGQVTPEKAIQTYFAETCRDEEEASNLSNLTIRLFEFLRRDEVEKAKEEIESAYGS